jgi:hypothetical protein
MRTVSVTTADGFPLAVEASYSNGSGDYTIALPLGRPAHRYPTRR